MLVNIEPIQTDAAATPNLWNSRYAAITAAINGNIDSDNLKSGAVTNEKIANGSVSSDKLGFEQYIDDNGWLITDLGLVKLATKVRTFKVPPLAENATAFVNWDEGMTSMPVGFNTNASYNMIWSFSGEVHVGNYNFIVESGASLPRPNTGVVVKAISKQTVTRSFRMHTWVVF